MIDDFCAATIRTWTEKFKESGLDQTIHFSEEEKQTAKKVLLKIEREIREIVHIK